MSISTEVIPICALQDNYIWMFTDPDTNMAWVIDPGDARPVLKALEEYNLQLAGIFITHHHHDHSGGVQELLRKYPSAPVYGSHLSPLSFITNHIKEGDEISCSDIKLKAMAIPGHTLDHTAYVGNGWLFSGDTLFSMGCGKIFEGTPDQMYHSLQKLTVLPDETNVFCGHEYTLANLRFAEHVTPDNAAIKEKIDAITELTDKHKPTLPSTIAEEKRLNPFLRCKDPVIVKAVNKYAKQTLDTSVKVFAKLREWKNHFKT
jgi:hydroxyacylglutathione hydrolase